MTAVICKNFILIRVTLWPPLYLSGRTLFRTPDVAEFRPAVRCCVWLVRPSRVYDTERQCDGGQGHHLQQLVVD